MTGRGPGQAESAQPAEYVQGVEGMLEIIANFGHVRNLGKSFIL
jgi:hypothetical protein